MDSILGDELKVFVGQQINNSDSLSVLAIDTVLGYKNTIESNYFKIPDSILLYSIFDTNPLISVIEVYFETPVTVRGEYYIGNSTMLDVSSWRNGTYLIVISTDSGITTKKLIIKR